MFTLVPSLDLTANMIPIFLDVSYLYPNNTFILSLEVVGESVHCCNPLCYYEVNKILKILPFLRRVNSWHSDVRVLSYRTVGE